MITADKNERIHQCLKNSRTVAIVGFSANPERPSHLVALYMQQHGYRILPVNPGLARQQHLGEVCYTSLTEAAKYHNIDIVDCFRQVEFMPALAAEAVSVKALCLWMQLGIQHEQATRIAEDAGLLVVTDQCLKLLHIDYTQSIKTHNTGTLL